MNISILEEKGELDSKTIKFINKLCKDLHVDINEVKNNKLFNLENLCLHAIMFYDYTISDFPKEIITKEMCLESIHINEDSIKDIPIDMFTDDLCLNIVSNFPKTISKIPREKLTLDICIEYIYHNGLYWLDSIPKEMLNSEFYFYLFLSDFTFLRSNVIKYNVDEFIKNKNIKNIVFNLDYPHNSIKIRERLVKNKYNLRLLDLESFEYLTDFLLKENTNNHFIVNTNVDLNVMKKIALSNNKLIILDNGYINEIHRKLADEIIEL